MPLLSARWPRPWDFAPSAQSKKNHRVNYAPCNPAERTAPTAGLTPWRTQKLSRIVLGMHLTQPATIPWGFCRPAEGERHQHIEEG